MFLLFFLFLRSERGDKMLNLLLEEVFGDKGVKEELIMGVEVETKLSSLVTDFLLPSEGKNFLGDFIGDDIVAVVGVVSCVAVVVNGDEAICLRSCFGDFANLDAKDVEDVEDEEVLLREIFGEAIISDGFTSLSTTVVFTPRC